MADRIRWEPARYSGWRGMPGTSKDVAFTITRRTAGSGPAWTLRSELPGMTHMVEQDDDDKVLRAVAGRWLAAFGARASAGRASEQDGSGG